MGFVSVEMVAAAGRFVNAGFPTAGVKACNAVERNKNVDIVMVCIELVDIGWRLL